MNFKNTSVILVSPRGDRNVGSVARAMGNFGLHDLRLVSPRFELKSLEAKRMSMQSYSILESAKIFPTLSEAQSEIRYSVALSGRTEDSHRHRMNIFEFMERLPSLVTPDTPLAFVFGREEWGLRQDELDQCDLQVDIPTTSEKPSLNLAAAVAITLALFFKRTRYDAAPSELPLRPEKRQEELFFARVFELLDQTKFVNPQNPEHVMEDLRGLYHRAGASDRELRILFGILSAIDAELKSKKT